MTDPLADGRDGGQVRDASMSLLRDLMDHPLDPGYAQAAARRAGRESDGDAAGPRRPGRGATAVTTFVLAGLAALTVAWAVRELRVPEPEAVRAREELVTRVEDRTAALTQKQVALAALRQDIAAEQARVLDPGTQQELQRAQIEAGEVAVEGPGVVVVLQDAPEPTRAPDSVPGEEQPGEGRVRDRDLQIVVNGLWAAGAEAVAVNGRRLTALSAIRAAGEAILVDFQPVVGPYRVEAVGDSRQLEVAFTAGAGGPYLQWLRDNVHIRTSIDARAGLHLPGAGQLALRWVEASRSSSTRPPTGAGATGPGGGHTGGGRLTSEGQGTP